MLSKYQNRFFRLSSIVFGLCLLHTYSFAQSSFKMDVNIQYAFSNTKSISNKKFFSPSSGFWDLNLNLPIYQKLVSNNSGRYYLSDFTFDEQILNAEELDLINIENVTNEYSYEIIQNEENSKNIHQLLILNCVRKDSKGGYYKINSFKASVKDSSQVFFEKSSFATQSVLSTGNSWYKFGFVNDGVYKMDYQFLVNNNIISQNVPSNSFHLYGNNSGMLNSLNGSYRPDDLKEFSIFMEDGNDGVFSQGDYFLFYAKGPHKVEFDGNYFTHVNHLYSDSSFCFLLIDSSYTPNYIDSSSSPLTFTHEVSSYLDFQYIDDDVLNLLKSGSQWLGDVFDLETTYSYPFSFPQIGDSCHVKTKLVGKSSFVNSSFDISLNNQQKSIVISSTGGGYYSPVGKAVIGEFDFVNGLDDDVNLTLSFNKNGSPSSKGYLDYVEINCKRSLYVNSNAFVFSDPLSNFIGSIPKFNLTNALNVNMVWNITDLENVLIVTSNSVGSSLSFNSEHDTTQTFVAVSGDNFSPPSFIRKISNQNLHGLPTPDMVIISPSSFLSEANELKELHENEGLDVVCVTDQQIYNEFSSGARDVTAIKQFLRMFYVRESGNQLEIPRYCLLFGDGSYDNRNRLGHGNNILPVYESWESLSVVNTYATDDYYAILSDGSSMRPTDLLNISLGRLPISSAVEAQEMVDKIKNYMVSDLSGQQMAQCSMGGQESVYGDWRNKVVLVSDDEDNNAYFTDIEIMSSKIEQQKPEMNIVKIHADAYNQESSAVGERIPGAFQDVKQKVQDGSLIVNYIGHGGETGWAHEQILTLPTIQDWTNYNKMPVFMTATCEFGRFDDHDRISAGEYVVLNPNGGGVGLFTTTRLVYAAPNEWLNRYFYDTVFDYVNLKAQRLGDIYMGTKNKFALNSADQNYRKFALLGDPALKFALPEISVITDSVNGLLISNYTDTINALSKVRISGHIQNRSGQNMTDFSGTIYVTVYDKKSSLNTLGTNSSSYSSPFQVWKNVIYKGKVSVNNGLFSSEFRVPKDISFQVGKVRISYYTEDEMQDGSGYEESLNIGGIDSNAETDNDGPQIQLFLNDENFVSGGVTNNHPLFRATIFDQNGINTVGNGIGHDIEAVIDDDYASSIILNDYYEADLDTYQSGEINYALSNLSVGEHKIKLKVWDVYNNSSEEELLFNVVNEEEITIEQVLNYPNPFTTSTKFFFEHNQVCSFLDVSIQVFNVSGKVVKNINERILNEGFRSNGILWDGKDDFQEALGKGVYVYKVKITNEQGKQAEKVERLFIL
jgi:hypothetical protein